MSVWLLLVCGVVLAIVHQDKFFAIELHSIARLAQRSGSVMVRSEGLVRWREAVDRQSFFDGDRVATGTDAKSTIRFDEKRALMLGEDTQVQVTAIQQGDGGHAFMITLFRGSMLAETDGTCVDCPPLILRDAGGETYNVTSGKKVALVKSVGSKAKSYTPKTAALPVVAKAERPKPLIDASFVKIAPTAEAETARLKAEKEAQEKLERKDKEKRDRDEKERKEKEERDRKIIAKGYEAVVAPEMNGKTLFTMEPLSAIGGQTVDVPLTAPGQKPEGGNWRPALEMSGKGPPIVLEGASAADMTFKVSIDRLRKVAEVNRSGGVAEYIVNLRGGAVVMRDKEKFVSFGIQPAELRIKSFGEVGTGPLTVAMDVLKASAGTGTWIEPKAPLSLGAATVAVSLVSGADFAKVAPFVRGAGAVGISREAIGANGVFVVRNQDVVAQVRGTSAGDKATAGGVMRALGGEVVFKGNKGALYDMRGKTQTALVDWVSSSLDNGKVLYILKRSKLYPVSKEFVKTNNDVATFIDTQARAIFLEKVEIVDYK